MTTNPTPLRIVQWATGNIGARSLRHVIDEPRFELVGVVVTDPAKVGVDAGTLSGTDPTGVLATDRLDDVVAAGPDCVLYMPRHPDLDVVCTLLAAGTNIVTTTGIGTHPTSMDAEVRARLEAACVAGASTLFATGSSPGFITEVLPFALATIQRRVDGLVIDEFADLSRRDSPGLLFDVMGFGRPPTTDPARAEHLGASFGPSLRAFADTVGLSVDTVVARTEFAVASRRLEIAAGAIEAGTVAAQRHVVACVGDGVDRVVFRANWYCSSEIDPAWDLLETGWRVQLAGDAPLSLDVRLDVPAASMAQTTPNYTANGAVNAVEAVCAAPPGIASAAEILLARSR